MNIVIDTNIWISALISKEGVSRKIIRLALEDKLTPQISTTLFNEYATIALTQFDAKTRFDLMASKGDKKKGLELLDKLDSKLL